MIKSKIFYEEVEINNDFAKMLQVELLKKNKEIERLNNKVKEQNLLLIEFQDMEQKLKLKDNIINKLEEYLENRNSFFNEMFRDYGTYHDELEENENILNKLKELKYNGSDEKCFV